MAYPTLRIFDITSQCPFIPDQYMLDTQVGRTSLNLLNQNDYSDKRVQPTRTAQDVCHEHPLIHRPLV